MKFQKLLMTGCRDMDKKHKKYPKMGPPRFFSKSGSVTFVPLQCPSIMQKLEKNNEWSLKYLKTEWSTDQLTRPWTEGRARAIKDPLGRTQGPKRWVDQTLGGKNYHKIKYKQKNFVLQSSFSAEFSSHNVYLFMTKAWTNIRNIIWY